MPRITKITEQKKRPTRRSVYLDGRFGFGCNQNVVARFALRVGMELSDAQLEQIRQGELRQECLDKAMDLLSRRLHSRSELSRKLLRQEYDAGLIEQVLGQLQRLGYVNDEVFARTRALSAAEHRHHGRRRAMAELRKAGVGSADAERAIEQVYGQTDSVQIARQLALKQAPRLRRLDPVVARRRLVGMLQRRGFEYDAIKPLLDEVLGQGGGGED